MTRKIETEMVAAIRAGRPMIYSNTRVRFNEITGDAEVLLHGNLIARVASDEGVRRFGNNGGEWTLAGWNTATTRSRINALARAFKWPHGVCMRHHQARITDKDQTIISDTQWVSAL